MEEHLKHTVADVKCTANLDQMITLEYVDGMEDCNAVKIGTSWYWVVAYEIVTRNVNVITLGLKYNPVTSLLTAGKTMKGIWSKTPTFRTKRTPQQIGNDEYKLTTRNVINGIEKYTINGIVYDVYFVQITSTQCVVPEYESNSRFSIYGMFCLHNPLKPFDNISEPLRIKIPISGGGYRTVIYPKLFHIINNIDSSIGISWNSVVDISISKICPYDYQKVNGEYLLKSQSTSNTILPNVERAITINEGTGGTSYAGGFYFLEGDFKPANPKIITENMPTDEITRIAGKFKVNKNGINIVEIPRERVITTGFKLISKTYSDYTGIYTDIILKSGNNEEIISTIAEGKLPFVGDMYLEYVMRSQVWDRQEMNANIKKGQVDAINSAVSGIVSSAFGGAIAGGGIGAGVGIGGSAISGISAYYGYMVNRDYLKQMQQIAEGRVKDSVNNLFTTANGMNYLIKYNFSFDIYLPANISDSYILELTKYGGYDSNHIGNLPVGGGYHMGTLLNVDGVAKGHKWERLVDEFKNGVRIPNLTIRSD